MAGPRDDLRRRHQRFHRHSRGSTSSKKSSGKPRLVRVSLGLYRRCPRWSHPGVWVFKRT